MASKFHPINLFKYFLLAVFILFTIVSLFYGWSNTEAGEDGKEQTDPISCTRTSRLENDPNYDRALSLIAEKYQSWEENQPTSVYQYGWRFFFPSKLTNCIKIVENNALEVEGAEGYFVFNNDEIKDNYFPIYVDKDYKDADDLITALLLVHEITHVRQFLEELNGKNGLSCIDKEAEAFFAGYQFYEFQYGEARKSLDLRIDYDNELHKQLQLIHSIKDSYGSELDRLIETCPNNINDSCFLESIEDKKDILRKLISEDEYYREQCNLED